MVLKLRELKGNDIFSVLRLVNTLKLTEPLKELISGNMKDKIIQSLSTEEDVNTDSVGFEFAIHLAELVIQNLPNAQDEVNDFLADLTETDKKTVEELPLKEYVGLIKDFFTHSDLGELVESLSSLLK